MNIEPSVYLPAILEALPRVFSMLDREPISKTFGCADRVFWSWKFIDFSGARFQEIANVLAEFSVHPNLLPTPIQHQTLLLWTKASIAYWQTLQHRDGSFDEAYPYERSLAATAFTAFYVGQAFLKIRHTYSKQEQRELVKVFKAAGHWLCANDERHGILSNHLAAAAAALQTIAEISFEERFLKRRDMFINQILQHQSDEGWYEEYGGSDPGYQTHTTFYLGYIWTKTQDQNVLNSLEKSIHYFWHFIHADGSIGGEYASRNTRFFMPAGFEMLSNALPAAAAISNFMRHSLRDQQAVGLHAMDTYNIFPLINNYLFALHHEHPLDPTNLPALPFHNHHVTIYEHSGHIIISTPAYQVIISTSKGGALNGFTKQRTNYPPACSNAGIAIIFKNGKKASTQGLNCSKVIRSTEKSVEIVSPFTEINQILMSPEKFIAFRLINLLSIPAPSFAYHLKNLLVKVLVRRKKQCPAQLTRKISWDDDGIQISDTITCDKRGQIQSIIAGGRFSAIHMGSSRYFEWQELNHAVLTAPLSYDQIKTLNEVGKLSIHQHWRLK